MFVNAYKGKKSLFEGKFYIDSKNSDIRDLKSYLVSIAFYSLYQNKNDEGWIDLDRNNLWLRVYDELDLVNSYLQS